MGQKRIFPLNQHSFYVTLRILLGVVFIWASWNKILEPQSFAEIIYNYQILPAVMVNPVALLLPWVEAICGICLISGYLVKGSVLVVDILMIIFIMALTFNVYRGVDVACGCFSVSDLGEKITFLKILRDLPLLAVGIWILYYRIKTDRNGSGNRKVV